MKLSEYKETLKERFEIVWANTIFTAQRELAYAGNNWASLLSTFVYTVSVLIFIKIIYSNVQTVAGYSYNEMLLFFFVYQFTYYGNYLITTRNLNDLIPDVNKGNLDMVLTKPVPSLFFLMTRSISVVSILTDAFPPILAIYFSINWSGLNISLPLFGIGILVWILGLISLNAFQIIAAIPVFWFGESQNILDLAAITTSAAGTTIPLEGYNQNLRKLLGTIIPMLIASAFTTSILLGKANPLFLLIWALVVAVATTFIKNIIWNFALKHYSSASS